MFTGPIDICIRKCISIFNWNNFSLLTEHSLSQKYSALRGTVNEESVTDALRKLLSSNFSLIDGSRIVAFIAYCYGNSKETEKSLLDLTDDRPLKQRLRTRLWWPQSFSFGDKAQVYTWEYLIQCSPSIKPKTMFSLINSSGRKRSCLDKEKGGTVTN